MNKKSILEPVLTKDSMTGEVHIELFLVELAKDDEMQQQLQDDEQQYEAIYLEPLDFNEFGEAQRRAWTGETDE